MGRPSYTRSVVARNVVMRRIPVVYFSVICGSLVSPPPTGPLNCPHKLQHKRTEDSYNVGEFRTTYAKNKKQRTDKKKECLCTTNNILGFLTIFDTNLRAL